MIALGHALETQWFALFAHALLSGTESTEVLRGLRDDWWDVSICCAGPGRGRVGSYHR